MIATHATKAIIAGQPPMSGIRETQQLLALPTEPWPLSCEEQYPRTPTKNKIRSELETRGVVHVAMSRRTTE